MSFRRERKEGEIIGDMVVAFTPPCAIQLALQKNPIGIKFLTLFEELCRNLANGISIFILFGRPNINANYVNHGYYDHIFAISILKKFKENERNEIYRIVEENIDRGIKFKFDKQHNAFQKFGKIRKNFNELLNLNFINYSITNFTFNSPRLSYYFGRYLLVGSNFDNITNIKLQLYRLFNNNKNANYGFYIHVGDDINNTSEYFADCKHIENTKKFIITNITSQEGMFSFMIGDNTLIPDIDENGNYYDGLIKEFGEGRIFIDKDPFSSKRGELIPLINYEKPTVMGTIIDQDMGPKIMDPVMETDMGPVMETDMPQVMPQVMEPVMDPYIEVIRNERIGAGKTKRKQRKSKKKKSKSKKSRK